MTTPNPAITAAIQAKIKERTGLKAITEPASTWGSRRDEESAHLPFVNKGDGAAVNAEVHETLTTGQAPAFPTASIKAAVRAVDALLPEQLEQRVLMIAGMYLNGSSTQAIADKLGLDFDLVNREVKKIDNARSVAYKQNTELAEKVVQKEFDVVNATIQTIADVRELREMMMEEMRMDHQEGLDAYHGRTVGPSRDEGDDEEDSSGKKKPKRRPSISPMKADSFSRLIEVEGKQLDRLTDIFALVKKHVPDDTKVQNINNFIQFENKDLNKMADMFLSMTGNTIAAPELGAPTMHAEVIGKSGANVIDASAVDVTAEGT